MSDGYVMVDAGLDSRGDAWEVGMHGTDFIVTLTPGAWQLAFEDGSERDRFAEAVARAVTPGQAVAEPPDCLASHCPPSASVDCEYPKCAPGQVSDGD